MKKNIVLVMTVLAATILLLIASTKMINIGDAFKFKVEYESLNGKKNDYDKEYVNVSIDKNNPIKYAQYDEIIDILKSGTGIIYFGFPECPWCRNAIPVLIDAAHEMGIDTIYYFNALDMRDKKSLDENGKIVVEEEGEKEYKQLVELMYDVLTPYEGLNDETIKRLYFPTVVYVKDGKILGADIGTVDSQKDPYVSLTKDQYNELKQKYIDGINKVYDILCDEAC